MNSNLDTTALKICEIFDNGPQSLIEVLHALQKARGHLSDEALRTVAHALNISRAEVHGVVSFYHDFRREPAATHALKICRAEACQAVGCEDLAAHAEAKLKTQTGGQSADGKFDLSAVYCLGNCALGPAVLIDDKLYGRVTPERLDQLVAEYATTKSTANE